MYEEITKLWGVMRRDVETNCFIGSKGFHSDNFIIPNIYELREDDGVFRLGDCATTFNLDQRSIDIGDDVVQMIGFPYDGNFCILFAAIEDFNSYERDGKISGRGYVLFETSDKPKFVGQRAITINAMSGSWIYEFHLLHDPEVHLEGDVEELFIKAMLVAV